ncbi:sulfurtransferase TusA [Marinomonas flavescens]|uniref:sulfurtransferase TusA n=1 Tax=Marinomonas flavescens TaxID=2529379 RepID=UPI0010551E95|nr:sulfurtransferase TusA [Marinomonas flavescens]
MSHQLELDTAGLLCPEPVMMLHVEIRKMASKEVLKVIATDPSTTRDIPKFCNFLGHSLVDQTQENGFFYYWIQKK